MASGVQPTQVLKIRGSSPEQVSDLLVTEEPMEIRLEYGPEKDRQQKSVSITMRTPGHDFELAVGFLYGEGMITSPAQIQSVIHCPNVEKPEELGNVVKVSLASEVEVDWSRMERHFYTTSSCGVCGKSSIEALETVGCQPFDPASPRIRPEIVHQLPEKIEFSQTVFKHRGGIHAAALFDTEGNLLLMREDIGRHNALDKLVGAMFFEEKLPLSNAVALMSGRIGFELVQKSLVAGIPVLAAVGAASSLSLEVAEAYGMTLVGFVREGRFNVYTGKERLIIN